LNDLGFEAAFRAAFPNDAQPVSPSNYGRAIQAYQATLVTPAPFDEYLAGAVGVLSPEQVEGLQLFIETGCASCHNGALLGGGSLQKFGVFQDYWTATGSEAIDTGRFATSGEERDRYVFRVPMLRNIAGTAPYFHDGSVATLPEAVDIMARVQLGRVLTADQRERIVAFLGSLTGAVPAHYSRPPNLARGTP
jgi:cytochrome c peroxidase